MELTKELHARIFAAYFGATVQFPSGAFPDNYLTGTIIAVNRGYLSTNNGRGILHTPRSSDCKLILKGIQDISPEDAKEIATILSDVSEKYFFDIDDFNSWMEEIFNGNSATYADYVCGNDFIKLIDFLRSKSYDCGYGEIPSLIAAGIAIKQPNEI